VRRFAQKGSTMRRLLPIIFGIVFYLALVATSATAGTVNGTLHDHGTHTTIDWWSFTVSPGGTTTIDVLSYIALPLAGTTFFDPVIFLFEDDGSWGTEDFVDYNDDDLTGLGLGDGSNFFDPYLGLHLDSGAYLLAIRAAPIAGLDPFLPPSAQILEDLRSTAEPGLLNVFNDVGGVDPSDHGDYQITFSDNVTNVTSVGVIPEPTSLVAFSSLALMGGASVLFRRRRSGAA